MNVELKSITFKDIHDEWFDDEVVELYVCSYGLCRTRRYRMFSFVPAPPGEYFDPVYKVVYYFYDMHLNDVSKAQFYGLPKLIISGYVFRL